MTVTQIKNGIIAKLYQAYPNIKRYGEEIKQGLEKPAFFVMALDADGKKEIGRRRRRNADFVVQYFPTADVKLNDTLYGMGDALLELFEYVDTGDGKARPANTRYEVVNEVLYFYLSFTWFLWADAAEVALLQEIKTEVQNG